MKRTIAATAAGLMLSCAFGATAIAQSVSIEIAPEARTEFRGYIVEQQVAPVQLESQVTIGAPVPETVTLQPVPDVIIERSPSLEGHQYFVLNEQIYVVEPSSRHVVTIIE